MIESTTNRRWLYLGILYIFIVPLIRCTAAQIPPLHDSIVTEGQRVIQVDGKRPTGDQEKGTWVFPFRTIQAAIHNAKDGDVIQVQSAYYLENINLLGKNIHIISDTLKRDNKDTWPTIAGPDSHPVVQFTQGERGDCRLEGFIISHALGPSGGAVVCHGGSPTLSHCLIIGHDVREAQVPVMNCIESQAALRHCTITDNQVSPLHAVIETSNSPITLYNSIVWGNHDANSLWSRTHPVPQVLYSHMDGYDSGINVDPLFVQAGQWLSTTASPSGNNISSTDVGFLPGDYHLKSKAGRWSVADRTWITDSILSPCIDAGEPSSPLGGETVPAGGVVNLGAYGATVQASKSYIDDQPIHFDNAFLKETVEEALGLFDPVPADMLTLTSLDASFLWFIHLRNLKGLEYAINLETLKLNNNRLQKVPELAGLTNLRYLDISDCLTIYDVSGLADLVHLEHLDMHYNSIGSGYLLKLSKMTKLRWLSVRRNLLWGNLRQLRHVKNLEHLDVRHNNLQYLDGLLEMTKLQVLLLNDNPWDPTVFDAAIAEIKLNNPGVVISY